MNAAEMEGIFQRGNKSYRVIGCYTYDGITYGPGEPMPEGLPDEIFEEFLLDERVAEVDGNGRNIRHPQVVHLNDDQIDNMLGRGIQHVLANLRGRHLTQDTLHRMLAKAEEAHLDGITKALLQKIDGELV